MSGEVRFPVNPSVSFLASVVAVGNTELWVGITFSFTSIFVTSTPSVSFTFFLVKKKWSFETALINGIFIEC